MSVSNGVAHVNFTRSVTEGVSGGLARRFQNGAWQALPDYITYTGPTASGHGSDITHVDGVPYVAWIGRPDNTTYPRVHVSRLVNGAWQPVGGELNQLNANARNARLAVLGSTPCVSFEEHNASLNGWDVYVKCFDAGTWNLQGGDRVDPSDGDAVDAAISTVGGALHVVWNEVVAGENDRRVRASRLIGGFWTPMGAGNDAITGLSAARSQVHTSSSRSPGCRTSRSPRATTRTPAATGSAS
jgi:hypothetical protein